MNGWMVGWIDGRMPCPLQQDSALFCEVLETALHLEVPSKGGAGIGTMESKPQLLLLVPSLSSWRRWSLRSRRSQLSPGSPACPEPEASAGRGPQASRQSRAQAASPAVAAAVCLCLSTLGACGYLGDHHSLRTPESRWDQLAEELSKLSPG